MTFPALAKAALTAALLVATATATPLDDEVARVMTKTGAEGIAIAVIRNGSVASVETWGKRNAKVDPLTPQTIMYAASLTKAAFAYTVMQLVDEGVIDLDKPIANYLPQPLPDYDSPEIADRYSSWSDLKGDERWRKLTARILLTHSSGFANFGFLEPDKKLKFHFDPGTRYSYSGDGIILLQFVLEQGLGLDIGAEMQARVFDKFNMPNTSMMWRADFAANLADGWMADGTVEPHDERSMPRAAGSMDTTITDFAAFAAGYIKGEGLSPSALTEFIQPQLAITTASQFPTLENDLPPDQRIPGLNAGLGVVRFTGPQGPGFFKGGHNDSTANTWVCIETTRDCVVILSNDVRSETEFPALVRAILGETGTPWAWEYGADAVTPAAP